MIASALTFTDGEQGTAAKATRVRGGGHRTAGGGTRPDVPLLEVELRRGAVTM